MTALKAHFDGKFLVPDEPVDLPKGVPLDVQVEISTAEPKQKKNRRLGLNRGVVTYISPDFDEPLPDGFCSPANETVTRYSCIHLVYQ